MRRHRLLEMLGMAMLLLACLVPLSNAALTPYFPTPHPAEVDLDVIMATLYGPPANYVRIDDSLDNIFAGWGRCEAVAKYAGNVQNFGYFPGTIGGAFTSVMIVPPDPLGTWHAIPSIGDLRFGLNSPNGGGVLWNSNAAENPLGEDHMVTFELTGGADIGDRVICWEDLPYRTGDRDYNDLVVQISNVVPEPAPLALLGFGLTVLGFMTTRRRRKV